MNAAGKIGSETALMHDQWGHVMQEDGHPNPTTEDFSVRK